LICGLRRAIGNYIGRSWAFSDLAHEFKCARLGFARNESVPVPRVLAPRVRSVIEYMLDIHLSGSIQPPQICREL
jgi:hypothetical protein